MLSSTPTPTHESQQAVDIAAPSTPYRPVQARARVVVTLRNKVGLHSRPAGAFARIAKGFSSSISVTYRDKEVDGKSLLGLLSLDAYQGAFLAIQATGTDAIDAVGALREVIRNSFGEPE
jgi:phosphocarrier protein HPr